MERFVLGINYWPRRSAMYMWQRFDIGEIRDDFAHVKELGFDVVRFFLMWEAFAPDANVVDRDALHLFDTLMTALADANLKAMPTLFCGHMSGVNWLPPWTLDPNAPSQRFRTIGGGRVLADGIGDFYADDRLLRAQALLARTVGERVRDSTTMFAWDLGNEFSNLREPASPADAARWSAMLSETLQETSGFPVTAGMHGEDLERDRHIRPSSIAASWPFATMHGYSVYSPFARDRLDPNVVPFLYQVQASCSGRRVLFSELGNPECPEGAHSIGGFSCLDEDEMALYGRAAIDRLQARGALGAFWWCWTDYDPALADLPPFDRAPHELRFGVVRADGREKPIARALAELARQRRPVLDQPPPIVEESAYYAALPEGIRTAYHKYCENYA